MQGDVLRMLGAETVQGAVPRQNRQPCAEAAALFVIERRILPQLHGYVRQTLLPVPLVRQQGLENVAQQRRVAAEKRPERFLVPLTETVDQVFFVQGVSPPLWDYTRF